MSLQQRDHEASRKCQNLGESSFIEEAGSVGSYGLVDKYFMKEKIRLLYGSVLCT